jgi:peptidoglycan/LPS O-acetylase OafA/YrhL
MSREPQQKNWALEGLRGLASLAVVVGHFTFVFLPYLGTLWRPVSGAQPRFALERILEVPPLTLMFSADAAVSVFFVMSGYVLMRRFLRTGAVEELQAAAAKRYIRLVLPSFVSVMFAWVLWRSGAILTSQAMQIGAGGWVPAWYQERFTFWQALLNGAIGAPLFGRTALNPPLWSIQVELIGSILLFAMLALFGKKRPVLLTGWFLFFSNVLGYATPNCLYYLSFLAGMLLHHVEPWLRRNAKAAFGLFLVGLICAAYSESPVFDAFRRLTLPNLQPIGPDFGTLPRLTWHTLGAVLLIAGTLGSQPIARMLSVRPLQFLGRISFAMYLIHMPLLMSLGLWVTRQMHKSGLSYLEAVGVSFVVFIATVILVSVLFERFVDMPSIRLAKLVALGWRPWRRSAALAPTDQPPAAAGFRATR